MEPHATTDVVKYKQKLYPAGPIDTAPASPTSVLSAQTAHWLAVEFTQSYAWLKGRLQRKLGSAADSEDIAASAFVELALVKEPTETKTPRAMLSVIANRLTYEMWRRRDLERAYLDALAGQDAQYLPSSEQIAETAQQLAEIDRLLNGLPGKVRQAFLLSQLDGLTHAEIAERLGVSARMVRNYLAAAMQHIYQRD